MNSESELDVLRAAWTSVPEPSSRPPLDTAVANRSQRVAYVGNLVWAIVLIGFAAFILRGRFEPEVLAWAIVVWLTTAASTAWYMWNWRGLWNSSGLSVAEYCRATLRAVRFGYAFLVLQLSISGPWLTIDFLLHRLPLRAYLLSLAILAVLTVTFHFWFRRTRNTVSLTSAT